MTLFEGRSDWLGHKWEFAAEMPRYGMPARAYAIGAAHLTMSDGGGEMITNFSHRNIRRGNRRGPQVQFALFNQRQGL